MATLNFDDFDLEKENYDRLLAVFHIGTDVKRYLLENYLRQNNLDMLDWLTNISMNFLQFEDIKRARKRTSKIQPSDLGVNTVDTVLKHNCFDLFWDCCLLNTSLEDILNNHKDELYRIYRNSNRNYAGPSMSTQNSSQCLTKDQWDVLFEEQTSNDPEGGENNISACTGLTVSCLDSNLNVLILNIVCPLYKSVHAVSECQIMISRTAVLEYKILTPVYEDIWNKIETNILFIGTHCKLSEHVGRKCRAVKQTTFNRRLAQENRKGILEEGFNNPYLVTDSGLCDRLQKELDLIAFEDTLYYEETLCGNEVSVPLVNGKYITGAYTECVLQKAEKDLQVCKSLCATTNDTKEMGDLDKKKEKDGIQERINRHNHLKLVQLITDIARDVLVEILKIRLPGCDFGQAFIGMKKRMLPNLNNNERQLLYPDNAKYSGDLNDLDITVLYIILRNISTICPHQNGWGHTPEDNDRSVSANIDRIRIMKNKFVSHSSTYSLTETEFLTTWKEIRQCIIELGGNDYTKRIDYLLTSEINPVIETELSIALEKLKESDQKRARMYINFEERFQSYQQELNMHKKKRFKKTRASECSGTVPVNIRISGDIVPSANGIIPADFASEDLCVNSFKEGSLIIDLDVSSSAIRDVGYFLNVIDMLLSALLQRDPAPVMDSSKYVIVSMEFPSYTYTKEHLQTSDIYKTVQSVKRQKKEAESEPNDLKKKSRELGHRSKQKEKKSSDTSLIDNDLMRTSFSNPSLVHFETSRTRPSINYGAHFTIGNDTYVRDCQIKKREMTVRERFRQLQIDQERMIQKKINQEPMKLTEINQEPIKLTICAPMFNLSGTCMTDLNTVLSDTPMINWSPGTCMTDLNTFLSDTKIDQEPMRLTPMSRFEKNPSSSKTRTEKHMTDLNTVGNDTKMSRLKKASITNPLTEKRTIDLNAFHRYTPISRFEKKPSSTKTRTEEHITDLNTVGSDTKKKQRMLSLTKTSGTETSTKKHMKDDKDFGSDTTLKVTARHSTNE